MEYPAGQLACAPKLLCEIHIEYLDGSTECIGSDEAWSVSRDGPIVFNAIRSGEWYDARKEDPKWVSGEANHWTWTPAIHVRSPGGALRAAEDDPIRITKEITPVSARITAEGRMIADMGQNFAGKVRLRVAGKYRHAFYPSVRRGAYKGWRACRSDPSALLCKRRGIPD